jgi:transposase-like protein
MTCIKCGGKAKRKSQRAKGGQPVYQCRSCKRKFIIDYNTGRMVLKV